MDIKPADIVKCLPLLASVLGSKYGVKVVIGGDKACTDGNVIHLPSLPVDSDDELLMLVKGYTDHESAHIRYTDFEALTNAKLSGIEKEIFNFIEDWRVEQRLSELYPGCRENLDKLIYRFFVEKDDWAGETPALSILSYLLLTLRSWNVAEVAEPLKIRRYVLEQNFPELKAELDGILERIRLRCDGTKAAIDYAREIVACLMEHDKPQMPQESAQTERCQQANGEGEAARENCGCDSQPVNTGMDATNSDSASQYGGSELSPNDGEDMAISGGLLAELENSMELSGNMGERIASELEKKKGDTDDKSINTAVECDMWQTEMENDECAEALRATLALRERLQGLLQSHSLKRVAISRHGRLAQRQLYRLAIANPAIFRKEAPTREVRTAAHILLDRSSSMLGMRILLARQTCYAISKALDGIKGMAHAVSAFPMERTDGLTGIVPVKRYDQRTRNNFGISASGSTPLDAALWSLMPGLYLRKESRKIILIITDGMPDRMEATQKAIRQAKKLGMEVYAIGIRSPVSGLQATSCRTVNSLPELPSAVFEMFGNVLLAGDKRHDAC